MKVKVKETQETIEVEFAYDYNSGGQIEKFWQDSFSGKLYPASQLEQIKEEKTTSLNKEELLNFLKENLKVKVNCVRPFIDSGEYVRVELYLGNERIDWDEDYMGE